MSPFSVFFLLLLPFGAVIACILADTLILVLKRDLDFEDAAGNGKGDQIGAVNKDAISQRLEEIYKRLELIDAYSAEARAASILAVST